LPESCREIAARPFHTFPVDFAAAQSRVESVGDTLNRQWRFGGSCHVEPGDFRRPQSILDKFVCRGFHTGNVCRPVEFITDDGIAEFVNRQDDDGIYGKPPEAEKVKLSEATDEDDLRNASSTIFRGDSQWLQTFIARADQTLDDYRKLYPSAGGLIVCRPGSDDADVRHLRQIAATTRRVTGHVPIVVSHDDTDANDAIAKNKRIMLTCFTSVSW